MTNVQARKELLKKEGRCYVCLRKSHLAKDCNSKSCFKCNKRHHPSICEQVPQTPSQQQEQNKGASKPTMDGVKETTATYVFTEAKTSVLLQTAIATVSSSEDPDKSVQARIIFDSGSQRSYVTQRIRESLNLPAVKKETLMIKTFGSSVGQLQKQDLVQLMVKGNNSDQVVQINAFTIPTICSPLKDQAVEIACHNYPHLQGLKLADNGPESDVGSEVDILIGGDYYWSFLNGDTRRGELGPVAVNSMFGWVLSGPVVDDVGSTQVNLTHVLRVSHETNTIHPGDKRLEKQLQQFWDLEAIGILANEETIQDQFKKNVDFKDGHYEVKLPWKPSHETLPDNYQLCRQRLGSLVGKLKAQNIIKEYDGVIKDQLQRGIIEEITPTGASTAGMIHYIPHHPVIRSDKNTTKLRIVYDASAKTGKNPSLNECLYKGPCLLPKIADVLVRFRMNKVALIADIEKAFLMVSVLPEDRDVLRFLWLDDASSDDPREVIYRFCRVVFGVTSSPFLLNATLEYHISNYLKDNPELAKTIIDSLYVDDLSTGEQTDDKAFEIYLRLKEIMRKGGFNLRKWCSNSADLRSQIQFIESESSPQRESDQVQDQEIIEEDLSYAKLSLITESSNSHQAERKVLGLSWNFVRDTFVFRFDDILKLANELPSSKRSILRVIAKVFDPLGVLTPIFTEMKVLFQELCQSKLGWDEPLSELLYHKWQKWCDELSKVEYVEIPRCYLCDKSDSPVCYQLHGFCDSSCVCYAAVVYLRIETKNEVRTSLVMSKTRVAPLSQTSIPRLELLSALILARLIAKVISALQSVITIDRIKCWTDSITALFWIQGKEKEWKMFVENRVNEIRGLVPIECWSHTPGHDNPADIPSRGAKASQLQSSDLWFHGPSWLVYDESEWPASKLLSQPSDECNQELKLKQGNLLTTSLVNIQINLTCFIDPERVSRFHKLLRITAYVLRFVKRIQGKPYHTGSPHTSEIKAAEILWIKEAQRNMDTKRLERQLGLFTDEEQVIRCKGRLGNAELPYLTRFPALLPRHHWLTTLIVRYCHERVLHNGLKETLVEVQSKFWITRGRHTVKSVLSKCSVCKRLQGKHYPVPESPDLPSFRVREEYAFSCVGVDFAGPLYVKAWKNGEKEMIKTYVALFTCASSRAVHLELVPDLEAKTFMLCLRRFVSRRGLPRLIVSDNAKTFKSAKKMLQRLFNIPEVKNFLVNKGIEWRFNLAKSPWWGGFFERMVKGVKTCLKKVLGKAQLSFDELCTILAEIEAVLNSRPLTYSYSDDIEEVVTPAHLIIGRRLLNLPDGVVQDDFDGEIGELAVQRRATYVAKKIQHFWQRWKREYLVDLREFHRVKNGSTSTSPVQIGDIVSIRDESQLQQGLWSMGKVERLVTGRDGKVRGAQVLRAKGGKTSLIDRPLQKLFPLEIRCADTDKEIKPARGDEGKNGAFQRATPKRAAAVIANERIGQYFEDE